MFVVFAGGTLGAALRILLSESLDPPGARPWANLGGTAVLAWAAFRRPRG